MNAEPKIKRDVNQTRIETSSVFPPESQINRKPKTIKDALYSRQLISVSVEEENNKLLRLLAVLNASGAVSDIKIPEIDIDDARMLVSKQFEAKLQETLFKLSTRDRLTSAKMNFTEHDDAIAATGKNLEYPDSKRKKEINDLSEAKTSSESPQQLTKKPMRVVVKETLRRIQILQNNPDEWRALEDRVIKSQHLNKNYKEFDIIRKNIKTASSNKKSADIEVKQRNCERLEMVKLKKRIIAEKLENLKWQQIKMDDMDQVLEFLIPEKCVYETRSW